MDNDFGTGYALGADSRDGHDGWGGQWIWAFLIIALIFGGGNLFGRGNDQNGALTRSDLCEGFNFQNYEQTTQVLKNKGYDINCSEWYAIMNAMHADYCEVAKMFGVDNIDFYAAMAKAWLCDEDAVEDKARQYWEHVANR